MFRWFKATTLDPLSVSMAGAKLGDRVLVIGCGDPRLIAALAAKTGMSGRTCAVDESADRATEAGRIALKEGVLVETSAATPTALAFEKHSFDLVVLRDVLGARDGSTRGGVIAEAIRVLRPGGRCMVIDRVGRGGIASIFGAPPPLPSAGAAGTIEALKDRGFVAVRVLAEREGVRFIEAIKRNT